MWVLGVMYQQSETLKRFDQVLITKREFDNVIVWNEYIHEKQAKKLEKLKPPKKNEAHAVAQKPAEAAEKKPAA